VGKAQNAKLASLAKKLGLKWDGVLKTEGQNFWCPVLRAESLSHLEGLESSWFQILGFFETGLLVKTVVWSLDGWGLGGRC
jgi:hypothetical protein